MNLFERCRGKTLSQGLSWINEPSEWEFGSNGELKITAPPYGDFFRNPDRKSIKDTAPFLYTSCKGDFILTTRLKVDMMEKADSGCLMLMADSRNWAKICYEFPYKEKMIVSVVTKEISDDCISGKVGSLTPYLRMARAGNCFAFHYSEDAIDWKLVRYFGMEVPEELKVGVVAQSPHGNGCTTVFDFLEYSSEHLKNIRSAE